MKTCATIFLLFMCLSLKISAQETGTLRFTFIHTANNKPLVLNDSTYTNSSGETYNIKKLKYYISNFNIKENLPLSDKDNYQLIDLSGKTSFDIPVIPGSYNSIGFLLGIDSIKHCSGAQTDALDPMNDMFWTWNTGYVIFKFDGTSPQSTGDRNRIEHHIGGFRFDQAVSTPMHFDLNESHTLNIHSGKITEIIFLLDFDKYWSGKNQLSVQTYPVCATPGTLAKLIAENFTSMFSVMKVLEHEDE